MTGEPPRSTRSATLVPYTSLFRSLKRSHIPVCAVDLRSGLDGASGVILGDAAPAELTVTFFRKKPGHVLLPGKNLCGEVLLADIGIPVGVLDAIKPDIYENAPGLWLPSFPWPSTDGHKYQRGHALLVGGRSMTGAADRKSKRRHSSQYCASRRPS